MRNFDFMKGHEGLETIHAYCANAEEFQSANPEYSALQARRALEAMVKTVFAMKQWSTGEHATLFSLTTDERFVDFIGSSDLIRGIHYVRKVGNNAAHDGNMRIGRRESYFSVLNLYNVVGSILVTWRIIETLPAFNKSLIPTSATRSCALEVALEAQPSPDETTQAATTAAQAIRTHAEAAPTKLSAQPLVSDLTEAETRKLYIDLMLREAGWTVLEHEGEIAPSKAGIEIKVQGMPNEAGVGYADYVLFDANGLPLAVVEAKKTSVDPAVGRHQAELYAKCLARQYGCPMPVIYYTNGFETYIIDGMGYPSRGIMGFNTLDELRLMISQCNRGDISNLEISDKITDRNYQKRVIGSVCRHFNARHRRALLVMATGTGKTRVSISLVDVLVRNGWVKNVLFLADRIELVNQAKKNYTKLLPGMTVSSLREKDVDLSARIVFSTYQTMINHLDKDAKTFSVGRFDLIIIDEAHRSVFGKYGAIFQYFDSLLLGLTATPRDEVDRSTYELFGMEQGEPTDSYEYDEAVADGYLTPFRAIVNKSKIINEGIKIEQLSPAQQEILANLFEYEKIKRGLDPYEDYSRDIKPEEIFSYLFNTDTVDQVLMRIMTGGIRVKEGTIVGKTIVFAHNHAHAVLIAERFGALYPDLGADFCRVIDNYEKYSSDLLDRFSDPAKMPQIAVSVDMLDTGIDVPEVVNLVFFKPIRSKIKFLQMMGRGTRLCPNLFGPGQDKREFLVFDFYQNFEYFKYHHDGSMPMQSQSIVSLIFNLRTDIKYALQDAAHQANEAAKAFHDKLADTLHKQISSLNKSRIDVRLQLRDVENYANPEAMTCLTLGDVMRMKDNISPLLKNVMVNASALKFDALVLKSQLALLDESVRASSSEQKIKTIATYLKEKKASIPQVMEKMSTLNEVLTSNFWETKTLQTLEHVRLELRDLIQYMEGDTDRRTFTVNIADTFNQDDSDVNIPTTHTYRRRVEDYLVEHLNDDATLQKIYRLDPLTGQDISRLEQIFWEELGSKEEFDAQTYEKPYQHNVAAFIRSIIGVEREIAFEKYRNLIHGAELTRQQEEYLRMLIRYVCENGDIATTVLQNPPFNTFTTIFRNTPTSLVKYVKYIGQVIAA